MTGQRTWVIFTLGIFAMGCDAGVLAPSSTDTQDLSLNLANGGATVTQDAPIVGFTGQVALSGTATLTRDSKGLWLSGNSPELVDGHAFTVWAAVFENSNACATTCGAGDLGTRSAQATISNFGGFVADASGDFEIHLSRHDASRQNLGGAGRPGVQNTYSAEIHFIVRSHGEAETDAGDLAAQTSEVAAFCNLPAVGCEDQGLIVYLPPGAPGQG